MDQATAKTKWCPFARAPDTGRDGVVAANRVHGHGVGDPDCMCLGPDCMAWRRKQPNSTEGYCGLVGSPWVTP